MFMVLSVFYMETRIESMKEKYILITGASGGIGKATALKLAEQGYSLYLHYFRNEEAINDLMEQLKQYGGEYIPVQADLAAADGADKLNCQIFSLNGIVYTSGKSYYGLIHDMDAQMIQECMQLHLTSLFVLSQKLTDKLMKMKSSSIVVVSSIWGDTGASCEVLYSMVKGGQNSFVKGLSKELAPMGVRVNAVSPGAVATEMMNSFTSEELEEIAEEIPLGRLAAPEEIASCISFLLSEQASYITGHVLRANGGWYT